MATGCESWEWLRLSAASNAGCRFKKRKREKEGDASPKGGASLKENTRSFLRTWFCAWTTKSHAEWMDEWVQGREGKIKYKEICSR